MKKTNLKQAVRAMVNPKNMLRTSIFAFVCIVSMNVSYAQFEKEKLSFGGGLGYYGYAALSSTMVVNLRGNYNVNEKAAIVVSYNYHLPLSITYPVDAYATSSSTTPSSVDVTATESVGIHNFNANLHYYFIGTNDDGFGAYGLAGAGLTLASMTTTYSSYDKSKYAINTIGAEDQSFSGFILDLGLGGNYKMDKLNIFGEFKIGFPAGNDYNSRGNSNITNPIPTHYGLVVGVRYDVFN